MTPMSPPMCPGWTLPGSAMTMPGTLTFFAINRSGTETMEVDLALDGFGAKTVEHTLIKHDDLEARNTQGQPRQRGAAEGQRRKAGGQGLSS